ncbi:MAG TPA: isoprenylcysteine carboxylmethyltransferase family protein [Candidatus Dormibacteraeota bacterium]|nr:isoprenylcysteine carboxylmethyltransferase family protein [Candidatus Dormibacteraeota bacterium]
MNAVLLHFYTTGIRWLPAFFWEVANVHSEEAFRRAAGICWLVFGVYWIFSALKQKAEKRREPWIARMGHILPMLAAFLLFNWQVLRYGWLGARFVPFSTAVGIAGLGMTAAGVALAIWARWHIGQNWSAVVSIRAKHELIGTGPYRTMRHPIYTGGLLAMAGTGLLVGEMRVLVAFGIVWAAFYLKARKEEAWLGREFGERFTAHAKKTGMFLPKI